MRMNILMPIMTFMTRFYHNSKNSGGSGIVPSKSLLKFFSLFCLAGLLLVSCEEDPTEIGKELLPGNDFVNIESTDTIKPVSFTMYDESIRTDNPATAYLGQTWDPYFGTTTATFVSQIRLKPDGTGNHSLLIP